MENLEVKLAELKTALQTSTEAEVKKQLEAEIKSLEEKLKPITELKEQVESGKKEVTELKEQITELNKRMNRPGGPNGTEKKSFEHEVSEKKTEIKAMLSGGDKSKEVEVKADTLRSSIATNVHQFEIPGIGQLARIRRGLYNIFPKVPVPVGNHNGTIAYVDWDEDTIVKAAAATAEGSTLPESTAKFKGYTLALRKVGDTLPVSEEFLEDEVMAANELGLFIQANVDSEVDDQLVNGDNTGQNLKGLLTSVDAYSASASSIADANVYDLIIKMKESITKTKGSKYQPDFAAMNETTMNKLVLKKDANYNYVFPAGHPIYSMIVVDNNIANDTLVVGDSRFARIYEKPGVTLSIGEVSTNFTDDMKTLKARKRLNLLIRAADKGGFAKSTQVDADINTLASA